MSDLTRRDVLLGTVAVAATAALPSLPEFPAINELVHVVERPTEPVVTFRYMANLLSDGTWRLTAIGGREIEELSKTIP